MTYQVKTYMRGECQSTDDFTDEDALRKWLDKVQDDLEEGRIWSYHVTHVKQETAKPFWWEKG